MIHDADRYPALRELRAHVPPSLGRVHPTDAAAARLASAVEQRRTAVYIPAWLRVLQMGRAAIPPLVLRRTRHVLPRLEAEEPFDATGLLGAGGRADSTAVARRRQLR
ncbi:hypothetical protein GCM10010313_26730 [Streptomyces violarus]|uniref:Uncharacterized protein n=1 Tax=Streptomyces violarus TaxID=67380 RepID=A0A7W4ZY26_9ACTN|nr:hypothetical protein [Streptomyces violarus]GHD07496.1 hypothetical protein GCM10010313_26730 [Streptomyces violarus]